jgi:peptidoglycan/xylan/chitin deacetylase (PgdA/CDA1 family)
MLEHGSTNSAVAAPAAFPAEKPPLRRALENIAMRAAGQAAVGLRSLLGSRAGQTVGILTYHRNAPHVRGLPAPLHNVTPERFSEQVSGLIRRGFNIWPLRRIVDDAVQGRPIPARTIAITFDDGFETVFTRAWPALRKWQAPATLFINTAYLDSSDPFPFDAWGVKWRGQAPPETYRPLTSSRCRELQAEGLIELGAHTHTHEDFRDSPQRFRQDLELSLGVLRSRFGLERVMFAFPFGSPALGFAGGALAHAARESGVACALTTESVLVDPRSDPFHWGRFNVFAWDTSATLAAKLAGWYSWAPKLRQRLSGGRR